MCISCEYSFLPTFMHTFYLFIFFNAHWTVLCPFAVSSSFLCQRSFVSHTAVITDLQNEGKVIKLEFLPKGTHAMLLTICDENIKGNKNFYVVVYFLLNCIKTRYSRHHLFIESVAIVRLSLHPESHTQKILCVSIFETFFPNVGRKKKKNY